MSIQDRCRIFLALVLCGAFAACTGNQSSAGNGAVAAGPAATVDSQPTPSKKFTADDIAKLKWLEGTWRGMDGDKPFFERYRLDGTTLIVDSFSDETASKVESTGKFELRNGEFGQGDGDKRSVASDIGDDHVQFVPAVAGKGNNFRFVRQADGSWNAILEWPAAADKPARKKIYEMKPWQPPK